MIVMKETSLLGFFLCSLPQLVLRNERHAKGEGGVQNPILKKCQPF